MYSEITKSLLTTWHHTSQQENLSWYSNDRTTFEQVMAYKDKTLMCGAENNFYCMLISDVS